MTLPAVRREPESPVLMDVGLLALASKVATPLAKLIEDKKLYVSVNGKKHVYCEGWTALAAMNGVTPHQAGDVVQDEAGTFTATIELIRMSDGQVIGRASAKCGVDEETWAKRPAYARHSMALTRATSKACRLCFSWIMVLSGYSPTPAEEMGDEKSSGAILPGNPKSWGGYGGKRLGKIPIDVLSSARAWLEKKDATKNATLIGQIDEELERRHLAERPVDAAASP